MAKRTGEWDHNKITRRRFEKQHYTNRTHSHELPPSQLPLPLPPQLIKQHTHSHHNFISPLNAPAALDKQKTPTNYHVGAPQPPLVPLRKRRPQPGQTRRRNKHHYGHTHPGLAPLRNVGPPPWPILPTPSNFYIGNSNPPPWPQTYALSTLKKTFPRPAKPPARHPRGPIIPLESTQPYKNCRNAKRRSRFTGHLKEIPFDSFTHCYGSQ